MSVTKRKSCKTFRRYKRSPKIAFCEVTHNFSFSHSANLLHPGFLGCSRGHVTTRCQALFPPHPIFEGKALETRLVYRELIILKFPISLSNFLKIQYPQPKNKPDLGYRITYWGPSNSLSCVAVVSISFQLSGESTPGREGREDKKEHKIETEGRGGKEKESPYLAKRRQKRLLRSLNCQLRQFIGSNNMLSRADLQLDCLQGVCLLMPTHYEFFLHTYDLHRKFVS